MGLTNIKPAIIAWLGRVASHESPPSSVVAFNVGLYQTPEGCSAYLIGADQFDADDENWACDESYAPHEKHLVLPIAKSVKWQDIHAAVVDATREFLASPAAAASFFATAQAVTIGFDDGNLERVA